MSSDDKLLQSIAVVDNFLVRYPHEHNNRMLPYLTFSSGDVPHV